MNNNEHHTPFEAIRISLASPGEIRSWSHGEVTRAETINYRTLKPEKDGLFCERIFGPVKDFECSCGKYKRIKHRGIICEHCQVEVTRSKVRRERMGHIDLAAPVSHIWFFKVNPSRLAHCLDMSPKELERILYFAENVVTFVDEEARTADLPELQKKVDERLALLEEEKAAMVEEIEGQLERRLKWIDEDVTEGFDPEDWRWSERIVKADLSEKEIADKRAALVKEMNRDVIDTASYVDESINRLSGAWEYFQGVQVKQLIEDDGMFRELIANFGSATGWGEYVRGGMGAEYVRELLRDLDIPTEIAAVEEEIEGGKGGQTRQNKLHKRLRVLHSFAKSGNKPEWMIMDALPVIPPELRPMVQLDGGRFATSDLNDLYRRVINRNKRLKDLINLGAPEVILSNEKRMLQEAVDALFDNGRRGSPVTGSGKRPLKSLADMLKGKQGRFRQNLLGKRVDYSGRSVIVAGPELKLHQCGLPKLMARELFKPFVMSKLVERRIVENIKAAKRRVDDASDPVVWDILEEVIHEHPVLLNRAPTLHRLGIQAFEPVLVEGKAIQVHPLVCHAFNADFDGDQMAVHVPLSPEAQAEARLLMLSSRNILSPASGSPLAVPSQDMVLGAYYLTFGPDEKDLLAMEGLPAFRGASDLARALDAGTIHLHTPVQYRPLKGIAVNTTAGRVIFHERIVNSLLGEVGDDAYKYRFLNKGMSKKDLTALVTKLIDMYGPDNVAPVLDVLKEIGFKYATQAGVTICKNDVVIPEAKGALIEAADSDVVDIQDQFDMGLISENERDSLIIDRWTLATAEVSKAMEENFDRENSLWMMANSGARGSMRQVSQLAGMRGLMANPKGEIIDKPIRSNFLEGLNLLEYFISTHGARKGLADTALRTADSGYMTRRLVDVAQDMVVREADCGTDMSLSLPILHIGKANPALLGRITAQAIETARGRVIVEKGELISSDILDDLVDSIETGDVEVRTPLHCMTHKGICQACYGIFPATGKLAQIGDAVGIIAAQSIGEPGTQLTMRTFHTGGVAGDDITQGLPRVDEIFEAREPKGKGVMAKATGSVSFDATPTGIRISVGDWNTLVPKRVRIIVEEGEEVEAGQQLTEGSLDPHELLAERGADVVARYLVQEVQDVYQSQGVDINDRHIELIVRQMLRRVTITSGGDSEYLAGELIDAVKFQTTVDAVEANGGVAPTSLPLLLGISKASLATDSFLSAASFQETNKVLTEAAIEGKIDYLEGLKENVIIGKLIPAATGMKQWKKLRLGGEEEAERSLEEMLQAEAQAAEPAAPAKAPKRRAQKESV